MDGEPTVESLLDDSTVEIVVGADGFTAKDASGYQIAIKKGKKGKYSKVKKYKMSKSYKKK